MCVFDLMAKDESRDSSDEFSHEDQRQKHTVLRRGQWWNVTKYIYSSTVFKYKFEVLSTSTFFYICYFYLKQHFQCRTFTEYFYSVVLVLLLK